jgi:hypothetical protein
VAKVRSSPEDYIIAALLIQKHKMVKQGVDFTVDITEML